ncbi:MULTISPECIES: hypothetical protein [unclassified Lysobacter]|uniref:hypothetical protein n=1 Tax=unclassified Lysobacter TaxID=2635362 RepID=UPI001BE950E2|nr:MULTISPECIES: hypothetical protein [unclassified Lysobacter]MBT2749113.1 hypothetical protein [Lysobacter sp. ISL-42]MBT2754227.1 hypothetical protein [Lysobacter sp. ISL-50]MBT2779558.1 hypothetical protein [Lysobacter sp. ISL-54]MBT2784324.1 hypothetical protein [Lysobacter sp. ISL-52]
MTLKRTFVRVRVRRQALTSVFARRGRDRGAPLFGVDAGDRQKSRISRDFATDAHPVTRSRAALFIAPHNGARRYF